MRIEHIKHSSCRKDFLNRVKENDEKKRAAKAAGTIVHCKRQVLLDDSCFYGVFTIICISSKYCPYTKRIDVA